MIRVWFSNLPAQQQENTNAIRELKVFGFSSVKLKIKEKHHKTYQNNAVIKWTMLFISPWWCEVEENPQVQLKTKLIEIKTPTGIFYGENLMVRDNISNRERIVNEMW
jgi:hypothetical protein